MKYWLVNSSENHKMCSPIHSAPREAQSVLPTRVRKGQSSPLLISVPRHKLREAQISETDRGDGFFFPVFTASTVFPILPDYPDDDIPPEPANPFHTGGEREEFARLLTFANHQPPVPFPFDGREVKSFVLRVSKLCHQPPVLSRTQEAQ